MQNVADEESGKKKKKSKKAKKEGSDEESEKKEDDDDEDIDLEPSQLEGPVAYNLSLFHICFALVRISLANSFLIVFSRELCISLC